MPADRLITSPNLKYYMRRQLTPGTPATDDLLRMLFTQVNPAIAKEVTSLGIEVGSGTIVEQRDLAQTLSPTIQVGGHLRLGAHMMLLCFRGYVFVSEGIAAAGPVTSTLSAALASRFARVLTLASSTGFTAGDEIQVGVLATPFSPVPGDLAETKVVKTVGTQSARQTLEIFGATGGTFTAYGNATLSPTLAYNISASALQTALNTLYGATTITVTALTATKYQIDFSGAQGSLFQPLIVTDPTLLTGTDIGVSVKEVNSGAAVNQLILKRPLNNTYASGVVVTKIDPNKERYHYGFHASPSDPRAADFATVYIEWASAIATNRLFMVDGKSASFNMTFQNRAIPTFQTMLDFLDAHRKALYWRQVSVIPDPAPPCPQNTSGFVSLLGNTVDLPTAITIQNTGQVYRDLRLTQFRQLDLIHLEHNMSVAWQGMFAADLYGKIIYNGVSVDTVSDVIQESAFSFRLNTPTFIGTSVVKASVGVVVPSAQFANYTFDFSGSNVVPGNIEGIKVVPELADGSELWYYRYITNCTSDVYSA